MANFYVYTLSDPETGLIRYIGKGSGNRAFKVSPKDRYGHCRNWIINLKERGLKPEIVLIEEFLEEHEALTLEEYYINLCKTNGLPITNLTKGGDGVSGLRYKMTPEQIAKRKALWKSKPHPNKGRKPSQKAIDAALAARKGKPVWNKGLSNEKTKASAAHARSFKKGK